MMRDNRNSVSDDVLVTINQFNQFKQFNNLIILKANHSYLLAYLQLVSDDSS